MKVAVLAPKKLGREIIRLYKKNNFDIDISLLIYEDYKDCIKILEANESKYDGIIFAGAAAYSYSKLYITPTAIWDYLPTHEFSLANTLLSALYLGYDIRNISTDLYSEDDFKEVFRVLHINLNEVSINTINLDICDKNCNEMAFDFHKALSQIIVDIQQKTKAVFLLLLFLITILACSLQIGIYLSKME